MHQLERAQKPTKARSFSEMQTKQKTKSLEAKNEFVMASPLAKSNFQRCFLLLQDKDGHRVERALHAGVLKASSRRWWQRTASVVGPYGVPIKSAARILGHVGRELGGTAASQCKTPSNQSALQPLL
jgi:hypothetical protein